VLKFRFRSNPSENKYLHPLLILFKEINGSLFESNRKGGAKSNHPLIIAELMLSKVSIKTETHSFNFNGLLALWEQIISQMLLNIFF